MAERKVSVWTAAVVRNCRLWKSVEDWGVGPSSEDDRPRGKVLRLGAITQSLIEKAGTNKHRHSGVFTLSL